MIALSFLLGLAVGSFLNAFLYRMEKGESAFQGRSYCPHCKHALSWQDLIPLVSFVALKGKCRYCKEKISWQYPLVELAMGLLFTALFFLTGSWGLEVLYLWAMAFFLMAVFVYDAKHYIIPDSVLFPALGAVVVRQIVFHTQGLAPLLLSGLGASGFFLALHVLSRGRAMGFGDVKLAFLMGLFLGFPGIAVALAAAFFLGAVTGLVLIAMKKKQMRSEVPFGPFLVLGTFIALFWGKPLVDFYFSLLLV